MPTPVPGATSRNDPIVTALDRKAVLAVLRRPDLWAVAARSALSVAPTRWWQRAPFLPLPDPDWLRFRLETAYGGDGSGPIRAVDLITYLEWRKQFS